MFVMMKTIFTDILTALKNDNRLKLFFSRVFEFFMGNILIPVKSYFHGYSVLVYYGYLDTLWIFDFENL